MIEEKKTEEELRKEQERQKKKQFNKEKEDKAKTKLQEVIKNRIDQLCKQEGITYYNLSYKASVPMTTLIHILDGNSNNPGLYTIVKICDGFGISLKEFFDTKEFEDVIAESRDEK